MKFFISSTYADLKIYRRTAIEMLSGLCCSVSAMEFFHASRSAPKEVCLSELASSDVLIGIYGSRYGTVDEESGLSMTELEYRKAQEKGIPILAFVADWAREKRQEKFVSGICGGQMNCAFFSSRSEFAEALNDSIKAYFSGLEGYDYHSLWEDVLQAEKQLEGQWGIRPLLLGDEDECIEELCRISGFVRAHMETGRGYMERLDMICAYLRLCRIRNRLLEEQWTEELRRDAIDAKDRYIDVIKRIEHDRETNRG